ncbi:MAG: hypothetical protein IT176_04785 [Acidobacteria bacterium]|nr:hypothetical protein [Acidobacteriota bacterium]
MTEIRCPPDCAYLAAAREHPAAAVVRRQQRDIGRLAASMRDLNRRQSALFAAIATFLARYEAPELQAPIDADVEEAATALAATFETSLRGVIYEHQPASPVARRLAAAMMPAIRGAAGPHGGGTAFERDAGVVLRRLAEASSATRASASEPPDAFIGLIRRIAGGLPDETEDLEDSPAPRLIVP